MPRIPKPPVPNCHIPISASEDVKLKVMEARLLEQLQGDFIARNNIKTINNESLIGEGDIHIKNIKEVRLLEETTDHTKYEIVFNDPADPPYTFTVKNGKDGKNGEQGPQGIPGRDGEQGIQGPKGDQGEQGLPGENGADGKSAYDIAKEHGYLGSEEDWLATLKGAKGDQGERGEQGPQGIQGPAGENGADGAPGKDGKDGLTTAIKIGESTYTQTAGTITLPESLLDTTIGSDFTVTNTVGGITSGENITADMTLKAIIIKMLSGGSPVPPVESLKAYFYSLPTLPEAIDENWESEEISADIVNTGLTHTYNTTTKSYICWAFPKSLGEIIHIYNNGLTMFDLITDLDRGALVLSEIRYNNVDYYMYRYTELTTAGEDKYQLLWK